MNILDYSSSNNLEFLNVKELKEVIEKIIYDRDMRAILINPSKVVRNRELILYNGTQIQLQSIFIKHNMLNETDVVTFDFLKEEDIEKLFLKSFYSSLKYSFFDIPFGSSILCFVIPENVDVEEKKVKKSLDSLFLKNLSGILNENNYLKIAGREDYVIRMIEDYDRPNISKRFKYLLKNPFRTKIVKEKYELLLLKNFVNYFLKKEKVKVIIDSLNSRSISFLKQIVKDEFFVVVGIGEKNFSFYSSNGIDFDDISHIEKKENTEKNVAYTDLLKKEADLFLEFGNQLNFNETMAKLINCKIFCEFEDLSSSFRSLKILKSRKIVYLPSLLLDSADQILDYFEILEKKREEVMSVDEMEMRFETYINFAISYFVSFLENEDEIFEIVLSRCFENYRKKFSIVYR